MKEIQLEYYREKDCLAIDPRTFGQDCIVQFGVSRFLHTRTPAEGHIHRGMLEVGFCMRNLLALQVGDDTFPVMPGTFFINQPDMPHRLTSRPNGLYIYYFLVKRPVADETLLGLPKTESSTIWRRLLRLPKIIPSGVRSGQVRELFSRILQQCDRPDSAWTRAQIRQTFLSLLVTLLELAEHPTDVSDSSVRLAHVVETVREHPERTFTIDGLSRDAALSPTHLINLFRKATGFPPIKFQLECRIKKAKKLLLDPSLSASQIAMQLGFGSLQHFSDTFSRIVGVSPKRYRTDNTRH